MNLRKMKASTIMAWRDGHRNTMLHHISRIGHKADLEYLLSKKYCHLEMVNERDETPLLVARYKQPDIVQLLLKHGANVHVVNNRGQSPLHLAVLAENEESVNNVLDARVKISLVDMDDKSALYLAVEMNLYEIAKLLLEKGANVNQEFERSRSVLSIAAHTNNEAMVHLLLNYGANVNQVNPDGTCPLRFAVTLTDTLISRILIQLGANVNHQGDSGFSALHDAVSYDNLAQVKLLVESNANVSIRRSYGITPLHSAAHCNNPRSKDIIRYLVDQGAKINDPDDGGNTSLHLAVSHCSFEVFQMLLKLGADINARNKRSTTILHFAAENDNIEIIRQVLNLTQLKPDVRDSFGYTPLHFAAEVGNTEGCAFLLGEGADINAKCKENHHSPVFLAIRTREVETIKFLLRRGAGMHEHLTKAIGDKGYEEISLILVSHLVRMKFGDGIASNDLKFINENEELREYFEACLDELARMYALKVYNGITMAEIVVANARKLAGFARNYELVKAFSEKSDPNRFPIYSEDVEIRMMGEWGRQKVILDASIVLNSIFQFNEPTHVVLQKIVSYLSYHNLTSLAVEIENV